jgi:DNA-binding MarR family transcriptional regulator
LRRSASVKARLVAFEINPHHRRAQLVVLTEKGERAYEAAMQLQSPWIDGLSKGLAVKDIETAQRVIVALRQRLESNDAAENEPGRPLGRVAD